MQEGTVRPVVTRVLKGHQGRLQNVPLESTISGYQASSDVATTASQGRWLQWVPP